MLSLVCLEELEMAVLYFIINLLCLVYLGAALLDPDIPSPVGFVACCTGAGFTSLIALCVEMRRPPSPVQRVGDCVRAVYVPKAVAVAPEAETLVGRLLVWEAVWRIDKGRNRGDWAMSPRSHDKPDVWVPLKDLIVKERRKALLFRNP